MKKIKDIAIPKYTLSEELISSISHGIGAGLAIWLLVILIIKSSHVSSLAVATTTIYGTSLILLYTMSCLYHALSPRLTGKKVLRILDHINVFLLVYGTIIPIALVGVGDIYGWLFFSIVSVFTLIGITFSLIDIDKYTVLEVICHLVNGWGALFFIKPLLYGIGIHGLILVILGGVCYTIGAIIYGIGSKVKYFHSIFHFFCLGGSALHFLAIYFFVL